MSDTGSYQCEIQRRKLPKFSLRVKGMFLIFVVKTILFDLHLSGRYLF